MAEPKNPFDFGTGSIDKDQWLRDIDAEQGNFVSQYSSAVNKHRAALMREAFADLRRRIANGDMLNRTADGLYQFSSALNREDKHMQEAYQRALGFMGDLARRQIQAPPATEPEKKALGNLEERYIKSLNPSGKFNTEAYWKNQTDEERRTALKDFLNKELKEAGNYQDFGNFGDKDTYTLRLLTVMNLLESGKANDWSLQQLGFTKNWLTQPTDLEETETPKSELEQANERLQAATEAQQVQQINLLVAALTAPSPTYQALLTFNPSDYWNYDSFTRDRNKRIEALKYTDENGNEFLKANSILRSTPTGNGHFTNQVTTRNTAWNGLAAKDARTYALSQYAQEISSKLNNYFKNLGVNYQSILNNDRRGLMTNLALLFTQGPDNNYIMNDVINSLFARLLDGKFGLRGSTLSYDPSTHTLYNGSNIDAYKEGGILKGQNGLIVDDSYYVKPTNNTKKTEETPKLENSEEMDTGDWVTILGTTAADIGSMLSANAVGAGTAVSAGLGVASTLGNSVNDFRHGNVGSGLANLGIGLTTDLVGLIPGFGAGAKGYKIGRTLTRFARPLMAAFTANNFKEAGEVLGKGVKNGFGNLTALDWTVLSTALTSMISRGKSAHTRLKNVEFMSKASQHSSPTDAKGNVTKHIINEEGFIKARKELLDLKKFGYNTASKNYTENVWKSIPEGGEIATPFYAKPFEWPSLNFGKKNKQALIDSFELQLKNRKKSNVSDKPKEKLPSDRGLVWNEQTHSYIRTKEIGGVLKALRNGGIIKAGDGTKMTGIDFVDGSSWYDNVFSNYKLNILDTLKSDNSKKYYAWLNDMLDSHSEIYNMAGGDNKAWIKTAYANDAVKNYQNVYGNNLWGLNFNELGIAKANNENAQGGLPQRYNLGNNKRITTDNSKNNWTPDGLYSAITDDRRLLGRVGDYTPELLKSFLDELKTLGYNLIEGTNGYYKLDPIVASTPKDNLTSPEDTEDNIKATDSEGELKTVPETKYKNPTDPTPYIIAGKTAMGLLGNRNIYKNLLDEMPQAPLRDPIDRKLAIVGWQEAIKQGLNQLADLRNATWMQHGSNLQDNLAGMYETEGKGRDIMNGQYMKDSERLFDTALKSWNLDNDDTLYNLGVGDANRKSIADRARMMAQIRAAWRSGDNNIIMGALSDAGNWMMKNYQRESDLIDLVKQQQLGTREQFMENYVRNKHSDYDSLKAKLVDPNTSNTEKANIRTKIQQWHLDAIKEAPKQWGLEIYNSFHRPGFGGGPYTTIAKDGTKLEVAKLKARSKDNDRYVSMIKDLRTTRSRRRRR